MAIEGREEVKKTQPEQTRARNSVYTLMHHGSHHALLVATQVLLFYCFVLIQFSILLLIYVCSLAIFRFVIKMHFFSFK